MSLILAVDPGPAQTGIVVLAATEARHGVVVSVVGCESAIENDELRRLLLAWAHDDIRFDRVGIETIRHSYGTRVGRDVLDTAWWAGRIHEAATHLVSEPARVARVDRKAAVRSTLKGRGASQTRTGSSAKAPGADAQVRAALIESFGGADAIGSKRAPGPLYGVTSHAWQALAVGVHVLTSNLGPHLPICPGPHKDVVGGLWGLGPWLATCEEHEALSADLQQRQESI